MDSQGPEQEQTVINLSKTSLTPDNVSVLSKGLSFSPTYHTNVFNTKVDLFRFYRSLHLKVWYHQYNQRNDCTVQRSSFRPKSYFMPPVSNVTLTAFIKKVDYDIERLFLSSNQKSRENLTKAQKSAIDHLTKNESIIIKPADKGGAVVIMDRDKYVEEALRQLNNQFYYQRLWSNPMDNIRDEVKVLLLTARDTGWISKQERDFLLCQHPRIPTFYMLPKIHKSLESPPGRPIISSNGSLTEPASQFIDFLNNFLPIYRILLMC